VWSLHKYSALPVIIEMMYLLALLYTGLSDVVNLNLLNRLHSSHVASVTQHYYEDNVTEHHSRHTDKADNFKTLSFSYLHTSRMQKRPSR
jgi:hypothetical protein